MGWFDLHMLMDKVEDAREKYPGKDLVIRMGKGDYDEVDKIVRLAREDRGSFNIRFLGCPVVCVDVEGIDVQPWGCDGPATS